MIYMKATEEMVKLVLGTLEAHHEHLDGARIAVVARDVAAKRRGMTVMGSASRPPQRLKPLLDGPYDFVITLAADTWVGLTEPQKRALVDHELCHCRFDPESHEPVIVGHDFEEFATIIARHGLWRHDGAEQMIEQALIRQGFTVTAPDLGGDARLAVVGEDDF